MDLRNLHPIIVGIIDFLFLMASVLPVVYASYRFFKKYQPSEDKIVFAGTITCLLVFIGIITAFNTGTAWLLTYSFLFMAYAFFVVGTYLYSRYINEPAEGISLLQNVFIISVYTGGGFILSAMVVGFIYQQGLIY